MSTAHTSLSFFTAFLITINTMFGSGIFINTAYLATNAGVWGFLSYICVALVLLPLIFALADITTKHPYGGFYQYSSASLGAPWGFASAWLYFIGKLASATLLMHVFSTILQAVLQHSIPLHACDAVGLALFAIINYFGLRFGTAFIISFLVLKLVPLLCIIITSILLYQDWYIPATSWHAIGTTIPSVLYAFLGFETACSISMLIAKPEKNTARVIIGAFLFTVTITIAYQFFAFVLLNTAIMHSPSYLIIFPALLTKVSALLAMAPATQQTITTLLYIATACAALGGSYGILFGNAWNLYVLAHNNHIPFGHLFTHKNIFGSPHACFIIEIGVCLLHLYVTGGTAVLLQQISVFGCIIAFTLSIIGHLTYLLSAHKEQKKIALCIGGLVSCALLMVGSLRNFIVNASLAPIIIFGMFGLIGVVLYVSAKRTRLPQF
ncbi:MAG: amino acid permease [Candidatus Babeliales bacterium]